MKLHTIWAKCKEDNRYIVSINGNVIRLASEISLDSRGRLRGVKTKLLTNRIESIPRASGYIYKRIHIRFAGKAYVMSRVVVNAFIGIKDSNTVIDHVDGNPQNNKIENLEEVTRSTNVQRAIKLGLK